MEIVFDVEGDGLNPTVIYCLCYQSKEGKGSLTNYDDMRELLKKATTLIGHNIRRWDLPHLERLLDIKITARVVDTLALSWYISPNRLKHGLEGYGEEFGVPKPVINDWFNLTLEEYVHRCEEDVKINTHLWNSQWKYLTQLYESEKEVWDFLAYLDFKMKCAQKQERDKWKLDVEYCRQSLSELEKERDDKVLALAEIMPRVPKYAIRKKPAKMYKQDGSLSKAGLVWVDYLYQNGDLPLNTEEVTILHHYEEPNPSSTQQIKDWLDTLGWKPRTFKYPKGKDPIPQINQEHGKGICESIKELYPKEPRLELLDGLAVLNHRIPILKGFLDTVDENGYVEARIQGLTNTLRFKHSHPCVNLPKPDRPYAKPIRTSLVSPKGYELCGADMSSLEDRLKQHFIYPLDPKYVESMLQEDFDPHLTLALAAGMMTEEEVKAYKAGDKSNKRIRDMAKNGNYACQYGAFPPKLVTTCGITLDKAKQLFDGYWKLNWAIKVVSDRQRIKSVGDQMWLFNPISHYWYSLRSEKDVFSTLIQGTASYVFDMWVAFVLNDRDQLTAQFHDEIVLTVKEGYATKDENSKYKYTGPIVDYLDRAIQDTNKLLRLNRELAIGIQFGKNYSEIH